MNSLSLPRAFRTSRWFAALLVATACLAQAAQAETLRMPNGELLTGSDSFGLLTLPRAPGLVIETAAPVIAAATPAPAQPAPPAAAGARTAPPQPPPGLVQKTLGLSDKWSAEFEAGLLFMKSEYDVRNYSFEATLGYTSLPHEAGLFASYNTQRVDDTVVSESTEVAARYFYHTKGRWIMISQADWERDEINFVKNRSNLIAVPGFKFIDRDKLRLLAGVGPSYRFETRLVPDAARHLVPVDHESFRIALYQVLNYKITPLLSLRETFLVQSDPQDSTNSSLRFDTTLRRMLTPHLSLNLEFEYNRDENSHFDVQATRTVNVMAGYSF